MVRLLVVEQGEPNARSYIPKELNKMGYRITLLNELPVWKKEYYEKIILTRLRNWPYISQTMKAEHERDSFDGVFCYNEGALPITNRLAKLLKLPVISRHNSDAFRHKDRMRLVWESQGVNIPKYQILNKKIDVYALSQWQFPLILKPASQMGSNAVIKANNLEEATAKIDIPFRSDLYLDFEGEVYNLNEIYGIEPTVLAEEYIEGEEYSAEGLVIGGKYRLLGITKKYTLQDSQYFDETGHLFPWNRFDPSTWEKIQFQLQLAHEALGIENAMTHAEFKIHNGRPVMLELGARLAGDHIPVLIDQSLKIQTLKLAVDVSSGQLAVEDVDRVISSHNKKAITGIVFVSAPACSYGNKFKKVEIKDGHGVKILELKIYCSEGDQIQKPLTWGDTRLGHIIFTSEDEPSAQRDLERLQQHIHVIYE
ncbi:ATP-grasp domain-containing protein [Paludifilum halophilum]|uniref:ATP-grasp domain-containing protein n=1 Tax=Paludifilum halophilum TaxID=1642702 RepID=A0A235B982_9BACL|nr:ATP-grasp domain-containing protein [Paludifilum halophilum]OYD08155.1 hypothetical protein CHM34_08595 [Paludifilum halophilum]